MSLKQSRARFQASSGNSDSANRLGYEADNVTVNTNRSWDTGQQTRHCNQEQIEKAARLLICPSPLKRTPFKVTEKLANLSKDVFERRTLTGSGAFFLFICLDAIKFSLQTFFSLLKTIYPRVLTKPLLNDAKSPLPVDVHHSKTLLLKLPTDKIQRPWNRNWKNVGDESHNNSNSDRSSGVNKERVAEIYKTNPG